MAEAGAEAGMSSCVEPAGCCAPGMVADAVMPGCSTGWAASVAMPGTGSKACLPAMMGLAGAAAGGGAAGGAPAGELMMMLAAA